MENTIAVIHRYFDVVWGQGNMTAAEGLIAADYEGYWLIPGLPVRRGPSGHASWVASIRAGVAGLHYEVLDLVAQDGAASARVRLTGAHTGPLAGLPATGRPISVEQLFLFHLSQGRIEREWVAFDRAGLLGQLGSSPAA